MTRRLVLALALVAVALAVHRVGPSPDVEAAPASGLADMVARVDPGVVHVTTVLEGERAAQSRDDAVGAGWVFDAGGWIVTSRHTLRAARAVRVSIEGRGTFDAQVVGQDEITDVAVLKIAAEGLVRLVTGDPRRLRKGDPVYAVGSPFHLARSWSAGIVSGLHRSQVGVNLKGFEDFIQTDAAANLGNSGGPLVDERGEVVGMMTAILSRSGRSQGVSLAVPADVVMEVARRLQRGESVRRTTIGVVVREVDTRGTGQVGLVVTRFETSSPAMAAGLRAGDVIESVDGQPQHSVADLQRAVWAKARGQTVSVIFVRGGQRLQVDVRVK